MVLDAKFWDFEFTLRTLGYRRGGEVKLGSNFGRDLAVPLWIWAQVSRGISETRTRRPEEHKETSSLLASHITFAIPSFYTHPGAWRRPKTLNLMPQKPAAPQAAEPWHL